MDPKGGIALSLLTGSAVEVAVDVLAFTVFGEPAKDSIFKSVDAAVGGALADIARSESFEGKTGQSISLYTNGTGTLRAKRVVVGGAGPRNDFSNPHIRDIAATIAQAANRLGAATIGFLLPALGANRELALVQMTAEGVRLGTYKFSRYLTSDEAKKPMSLKTFGILLDFKGKKPSATQTRGFATAVERGNIVSGAINHARDLINEPAAVITPAALAADAQDIAKRHKGRLTVTVLDAKKCEALGM